MQHWIAIPVTRWLPYKTRCDQSLCARLIRSLIAHQERFPHKQVPQRPVIPVIRHQLLHRVMWLQMEIARRSMSSRADGLPSMRVWTRTRVIKRSRFRIPCDPSSFARQIQLLIAHPAPHRLKREVQLPVIPAIRHRWSLRVMWSQMAIARRNTLSHVNGSPPMPAWIGIPAIRSSRCRIRCARSSFVRQIRWSIARVEPHRHCWV